ncbi:MAG: HEAT repeat protein [Planctomycetota bacterium]|jgi:HEAT repeat protein
MRVRLTHLLSVLTGLLLTATTTAQISLRDVPELARQRAERLRPLQIAALEPFWEDFALEYSTNTAVLDDAILKASKLGDSVVPLLLEKLQPAQGGSTSRNMASNCRRVLSHLDPGSFVDALAKMARGSHDIARTEAIILLGHADVPQSSTVLTDLIDSANATNRSQIIRSLRRLRSPTAAPKIVGLLGSNNRRTREEVLAYLIAAKASSVVDTVVQALSTESDDRLLPSFIDYFAACTTQNVAATEALLPLLSRERIDWQDTRTLVEALATVAPKGHKVTIRKLHELIDGNDTSSLAVQAALTLRSLGDRKGITRLKRTLDDKVRRRNKEATLYEQRSTLLFAIDEFSDALNDFEKMVLHSEGATMTRRAYVGVLKCESRRNKVTSMVKHMKASGMLQEDFDALAEQDEHFRNAMNHDRVKTFLKQLAKDRAPK